MVFDSFFNSIFGSLLEWDVRYALIIISFILTLIVTVAYKYLTNQTLLKGLKDELKELQKEMKDLKDEPGKAMEKQKELMEKNLKLMGHTLKPSLYTLVPLLIIFSWLNHVFDPLGKVFFGLSWIGFLFGLQFEVKRLMTLPRRYFSITAIQSSIVFILVSFTSWYFFKIFGIRFSFLKPRCLLSIFALESFL